MNDNTEQIKILAVDDIAVNIQILAHILTENNFQVLSATNGNQAISIAENKLPDLILLDIQMPGMNGFEVCTVLKNNIVTKNIPIIFITAKTEKTDIVNGFKVGAADYITKPFNSDELLARINAHIELKKSRDTINNQKNELANLNIQLLEQKVYLESLLENLPTAVAIININGKIIRFNYSFTELFGYELSDVYGQSLIDLIAKDNPDEYLEFITSCVNGKTCRMENSITAKNYDKKIVLQIGTPIVVNNNEIGVYVIFTDITSIKQGEIALRENAENLEELNRTKDKFFSIIAHDLRSPIGNLVLFIDVLHKNFHKYQTEEVFDIITTLKDSTNKLYTLIKNLLEWSKLQITSNKIELQVIELDSIIIDTIDIMKPIADSKSISLIIGELSHVSAKCEKNMISTILRNLISNSIKFTESSGTINIYYTVKENFVEISVKDSGIGMPPEVIEKLFKLDKLITTVGTQREKGTGLGLILCKEFVEKCGGELFIESKIEEGSRIYFQLPKA